MTTLQEFARSAARKYLQSIVFVDDEIYTRVPAQGVRVEAIPASSAMNIFRKPIEPTVEIIHEVSEVDLSTKEEEIAAQTETGAMYHPKHLVESFARERMVCALYEPNENFSTDPDSELFKLCERADVVILDWEFHKMPGEKVKQLIAGLVAEAQTTLPHHVRLCAIYTSTPNLKQVAQQVFDHLAACQLVVRADGDYDLLAGSSRIIVLGKPTTGRPGEQKAVAEVAEDDLAQRIIAEFAKMHMGILPSMALHGLASVRTNTKKILDKFRADMDGAFLINRALVWPDDDAFEQIPELLAEETLAVMIDTRLSDADATKMAEHEIERARLKTEWQGQGVKEKVPPGELATKFLKEGLSAVNGLIKIDNKKIRQLHTEWSADSDEANQRLAALYVTRTQYGDKRYLEFGTVIRYTNVNKKADGDDKVEESYAVCLMPLCDCVRLTKGETYRFPFWRLKTASGKGNSKGLVIERPGEDAFVELFSYGKPRDQLWMDEFSAGADNMVAAEKNGDKFLLQGRECTYEWIAQLKPSHAQRIAHDLGTSLARVGVIEAEWVRRKAENPDRK
ncbi:response regulator receiver domain [Kozakia baliensis]|uniref:response regulator receiver domain n=1 Tax=Kozakia baliensis TaxID=153496 RepID=UPI000495C738|nr:response regulator receiver domain [Kozakia baliensis]